LISFYDYEDWQYNILMEPIIQRDKWRKGSQVCVTPKLLILWLE
jgi:hypothetical protein